MEVVTDAAVFLPAGSADGYGVATVSAHAIVAGEQGISHALDINLTYGTAMYVRNVSSFHGGKRRLDVPVVTSQDRQNAIALAKASVTAYVARTQAILAKPCSELVTDVVKWTCQFVRYPSLSGVGAPCSVG